MLLFSVPQYVESSNLKAYAWKGRKPDYVSWYETIDVRIWFKNGTVYDYTAVPVDQFDRFVMDGVAESWGKSFYTHIKDKFEFEQRR